MLYIIKFQTQNQLITKWLVISFQIRHDPDPRFDRTIMIGRLSLSRLDCMGFELCLSFTVEPAAVAVSPNLQLWINNSLQTRNRGATSRCCEFYIYLSWYFKHGSIGLTMGWTTLRQSDCNLHEYTVTFDFVVNFEREITLTKIWIHYNLNEKLV